jgi:hypothetical protein
MPQLHQLQSPPGEIHPEAYGCLLVNGSAKMIQKPGDFLPTVSGTLPDGRAFSGVTLAAMHTP